MPCLCLGRPHDSVYKEGVHSTDLVSPQVVTLRYASGLGMQCVCMFNEQLHVQVLVCKSGILSLRTPTISIANYRAT